MDGANISAWGPYLGTEIMWGAINVHMHKMNYVKRRHVGYSWRTQSKVLLCLFKEGCARMLLCPYTPPIHFGVGRCSLWKIWSVAVWDIHNASRLRQRLPRCFLIQLYVSPLLPLETEDIMNIHRTEKVSRAFSASPIVQFDNTQWSSKAIDSGQQKSTTLLNR